MTKEEWLEMLEFNYKTFSGTWITDKDCKELYDLINK